jgi:uncharacterized membrane protein YphA (DoxX/SURF4 family)
MGLTGMLETFGGLLLLLGLFTRLVAFVLSGMMAVAYITAHAPPIGLAPDDEPTAGDHCHPARPCRGKLNVDFKV